MATGMKYRVASLSRLAQCFEHEGFTTKMLLEFFITLGWIEDSKTVTPKGVMHGVRKSSKGDYLVYRQEAWDMIKKHTYRIQRHFGLPFTVQNPDELKARISDAVDQNKTAIFQPIMTGETYPYLGLSNFLILDTETTGNSHLDEIVEIGVIDMEGNVVYESYFLPEKRFSAFASQVNHLTKEVLKRKGALLFKDEWPKIVNLLKGHVLLGHNLSYDKRMIVDTCKRYGLDYTEAESLFSGYYDSRNLAKKWMIAPNYKLNDLSTMLGITWEETHDATDDCKMTLQFLNALEDAIGKRKKGSEMYPFLKTPY